MNTFDNNTPGADPRIDRDPWAELVKKLRAGFWKPLESADAIESLRAEVESLRKDAERYRYISSNERSYQDAEWLAEVVCGTKDFIDAAIDAAMEKSK